MKSGQISIFIIFGNVTFGSDLQNLKVTNVRFAWETTMQDCAKVTHLGLLSVFVCTQIATTDSHIFFFTFRVLKSLGPKNHPSDRFRPLFQTSSRGHGSMMGRFAISDIKIRPVFD